jgi:hypothetical protein
MALNPNLNYNHIFKLRQNITKSRLNSINTKTNVREKQKHERKAKHDFKTLNRSQYELSNDVNNEFKL